jgi:exodeoxyribonuclease VII large subunit
MMKNVYSVGQVNTYIKNMFAQDFMMQRISVKGEVSNCKYHSSRHIYFTLKDPAGRSMRSCLQETAGGSLFR